LVKGQLNEKDDLNHPPENEEYFETQLIDDMILVQNFIFEQVKEEQKNGIIEGQNYNSKDLFPSLNDANPARQRKEAHGRNIKEETQKSYMMQKQQQYNRPINDYFYQKPTFEVNDKEKIWNNYLETMYVASSVSSSVAFLPRHRVPSQQLPNNNDPTTQVFLSATWGKCAWDIQVPNEGV